MKSPDTQGVITWGPGPLEPHQQLDLSWYAIHPIEMLYALMGLVAWKSLARYAEDAEVITGKWNDGSTGTVRALRPYGPMARLCFAPSRRMPKARAVLSCRKAIPRCRKVIAPARRGGEVLRK